jgi:hypothetical protein
LERRENERGKERKTCREKRRKEDMKEKIRAFFK